MVWPQHYITATVQYQCLSGLTDPSTISPLQYSTNVQVVWLTPALYHRYSTVPMFKWSDWPQHYITTTVQYQCLSGLTPTLYHNYSTVPVFKWSDWPQHYTTAIVPVFKLSDPNTISQLQYQCLPFPVYCLKFCARYVVDAQQPMVFKKEQTLAIRRGCTATHGF